MELDSFITKYYRTLFILPNTYILLSTYFGLIVILTLITSLTLEIHTYLQNFLTNLKYYLVFSLTLLVLYLVSAPLSVTLNAKRVLGLVIFMVLITYPAEITSALGLKIKGLGVLLGSGALLVILQAFTSLGTALLLSSIPPFLTYIVTNYICLNYLNMRLLTIALCSEIASLVLGIQCILGMENLGKELGYSPLKAARAFLKTWLTGIPGSLEKELSRGPLIEDLKVKIIILLRNSLEPIALIFPTLHFGPFRNVGSARFIYQLEERLEPRLKTLVFHTAGSHEHNLVSSEDSEKIAKIVSNAIDNYHEIMFKFRMCRPYRVKGRNGWEAFVLNGPTFIAIFLVNKLKGNDDLPYVLWKIIEENPRAPLLAAIADSHSFKGPREVLIDELIELINNVYTRYSCTDGEKFYIGYGEGHALVSECEGLCYDLVKVITLRFSDNERYGIIYIYGNNMDGNFRLELEKIAKDLGLKDVEVVTPDDHSCAASFKETPYSIVKKSPSLINAVRKAIEEAIANEVEGSYTTLEVVVKDVKFVGDLVFDITRSLGIVASRFKRVFSLLILTINVIPVILTILNFMFKL